MPTVTLTFSAAHAARIQEALTFALRLEQPATLEDFKGYIVADVKQLIRNTERQIAREAAESPITDVDLT